MESTFPFGLEPPLQFYLTVYLLTLVLHVVFMSYVLAGSLWLAAAALFPGSDVLDRSSHPIATVLRDWMPFALGGAITAGVAPLLFVQILYKRQFYTANLLLGWRWMVVPPILVAAFYLLYILKSKNFYNWPLPLRVILTLSAAGCFLFVAFCWSVNHLLGLDAARWPAVFVSGQVVQSSLALGLRLAAWVAGTVTTMCLIVAWQLRGLASRPGLPEHDLAQWNTQIRQDETRLAPIALFSLVASLGFGVCYYKTLPDSVRALLIGPSGLFWIAALLALGLFQCVLLLSCYHSRFSRGGLAVGSLNMLAILLSVAVLRELIRLSQVDLVAVARSTAAASRVGGFGLFAGFGIFNLGLIIWCIRLVQEKTTPE